MINMKPLSILTQLSIYQCDSAGRPELGSMVEYFLGSCHVQKSAIMPCIFGLAPYPSNVFNIQPRSRLWYVFIRDMNTKKSGSWSTLSSSCTSFISMMAVPVNLPAKNPWRTSWNVMAFWIHVLILASITFQRTFRIPIPWFYMLPLGIKINIFHLRSAGILPRSHIGGGGGVVESFAWYASLSHVLNLSAFRCVCPPDLFTLNQMTFASTSDSVETLSRICRQFWMGRCEWVLSTP